METNNTRYLSIKPQFQEQAQEIATQRPKTFKNGSWQEVIRLAIFYGLPEIGRVQERERKHQARIKVRKYIKKSNQNLDMLNKCSKNVPVPTRVCKHTKEQTTCSPGLYNCKDCDSVKK